MLLGWLCYLLLRENPWVILAAEAGILLSAYLATRLYRSIIAPVRLLNQGAAALRDQDFSVKLLPTGSREMDGVVTVYNHMIDQLRSERVAGKQREEFLDRLLESANLGVAILGFDGGVETMNGWLSAQCRSEAFRAAVLQPTLHPRPRPENGPPTERQHILPGPGGRRYHVERASFIDRGFERDFLIVQDVTAELLTAEKEAYGKVIRMIAHEVNNTNAAVISILRTLLEAAGEELPDLTARYLPAAIGRAENMTAFIRNFANVVRLPPPVMRLTSLNDLLRATGDVLAPTLAEAAIELTYKLHPAGPVADVDGAQLEQVVVNALANARQSIGRGGKIVISSTAEPPGFTVADDGPGIEPATAALLFTPFFSTKPTGQGVGLTLARDILAAHGAEYHLSTEEDGWTRFRVTLPQPA